jgi:tetratricopeptide (TPR) repeat protein
MLVQVRKHLSWIMFGLVLTAGLASAQGGESSSSSNEWESLAELARQGSATAPRRPLLVPTEAGAPPLALDPYLHLLAARDRQAARDFEGAETELAAALELDPDLLEAHLFAARLDLTRSPAAAAEHLEAAFRSLRHRFALQAWTLASLAWGTLVFLLAWMTLLAMAYASHRVAPVHHLVSERLRRLIDPRLAGPLAGVMILLPLVWGVGPLILALLILTLSGARRSRGERAVLWGGIATLLLCGLLPLFPPGALRPTTFRDQAQVLDFAAHAPLTRGLSTRLDSMSESGIDLALLVHGQALLRDGDTLAARPRLERYIVTHSDDPRAFVALGNLDLATGNPIAAVHRYRQSIALDSTTVEPHVNLALAYSALMQFEMANAELALAARFDRKAATLDSRADRPAVSLPVKVHPAELWAIQRRSNAAEDLRLALPTFVQPLLPFGGGSSWMLGLLLVGFGLGARQVLARRLNPFPCSVCARSVCRRCVTRRRGLTLCSRCQGAIGDVPAEQVVRQLVAIERQRMKSQHQLRRLGWNTLCPGQGLLLASRPRSAALLLAALALVVMGFLTRNHPIVPLPTVPAGGLGPLPDPAAALGLAAAWLAAAAISTTVRPSLGGAVRGRIVPLAAGPAVLGMGKGDRGGRRAFTGTDG